MSGVWKQGWGVALTHVHWANAKRHTGHVSGLSRILLTSLQSSPLQPLTHFYTVLSHKHTHTLSSRPYLCRPFPSKTFPSFPLPILPSVWACILSSARLMIQTRVHCVYHMFFIYTLGRGLLCVLSVVFFFVLTLTALFMINEFLSAIK